MEHAESIARLTPITKVILKETGMALAIQLAQPIALVGAVSIYPQPHRHLKSDIAHRPGSASAAK
jgi:hypothetical protein